jgi:hypothetical protein
LIILVPKLPLGKGIVGWSMPTLHKVMGKF